MGLWHPLQAASRRPACVAGRAGLANVVWQARQVVRPRWFAGCGLAPEPKKSLISIKWHAPMQSSSSSAGAAAAVGRGVGDAAAMEGAMAAVGSATVVVAAGWVGSAVADMDAGGGVVTAVGLPPVLSIGEQATTARPIVTSDQSRTIWFVFMLVSCKKAAAL